MTNWKITSRIWGILGLTLLIGALSAGFLYVRLNAVVSAYERLFDQNVRDQDLSRVMQVTFKKQVQDWKDIPDPRLGSVGAAKVLRRVSRPRSHGREIAATLKREVSDPEIRGIG